MTMLDEELCGGVRPTQHVIICVWSPVWYPWAQDEDAEGRVCLSVRDAEDSDQRMGQAASVPEQLQLHPQTQTQA